MKDSIWLEWTKEYLKRRFASYLAWWVWKGREEGVKSRWSKGLDLALSLAGPKFGSFRLDQSLNSIIHEVTGVPAKVSPHQHNPFTGVPKMLTSNSIWIFKQVWEAR